MRRKEGDCPNCCCDVTCDECAGAQFYITFVVILSAILVPTILKVWGVI